MYNQVESLRKLDWAESKVEEKIFLKFLFSTKTPLQTPIKTMRTKDKQYSCRRHTSNLQRAQLDGDDSLIIKANKLHQQLNDLTYPYPIRWNHTQNRWLIESSPLNLSSYYGLPCLYKWYHFLALAYQPVYLSSKYESFPSHYMPLTFIEVCSLGICLSVDLICYFHGEALVLATNWAYKKGRTVLKNHKVFGKQSLKLF